MRGRRTAGVLVISVQDEAGKVDVNSADERLLRALLAGAGVRRTRRLADALHRLQGPGWRPPPARRRAGRVPVSRPSAGTEERALSVVDELEQVLGLNAADVARAAPARDGLFRSDGGRAEPGVAEFHLAPAVAARGVDLAGGRFGDQGVLASKPTSKDDAEFVSFLRQLPREFAGGQGGRHFSVRSEAHAGRAIFVREAIVELGTSRARPYVLHRWYRGTVRHDGPARGTEGGAACAADALASRSG